MSILSWVLGFVGAGGMITLFGVAFGFSKPKLEFKFIVTDETIDSDKVQCLTCLLTNSPFRSLVMRVLHMQRPNIDVASVSCDVFDRMSSPAVRVGKPFLADIVNVNGRRAKQLPLPADRLPVSFRLLTYVGKEDAAWLQNVKAGDVSLSSGVFYIARVTAIFKDEKVSSQVGFVIKDKITLIPVSKSYLQGV